MKKYSFWQKLRYWFDNLMSKGTASLLLLLAVITTLVVITGGLLTVVLGGADGSGGASPGSSIWFTLMHTISTGVLTKEEGTVPYLAVMTIVTLTGMFITSFLIGTISNGIKDKVTSLQRGRSRVIETGHTIVIGFDENIISILEELVMANENTQGAVVVVMAEKDKVSMEEIIKDRLPDTGNLRIVCRSGQPDSLTDLKICSPDTCRSIIVNLNDDAMTLKTILVCESLLDECGNSQAYITATIRDREVLHPSRIAGGERSEILNFQKTMARLMIQSGRHPGMSEIFSELLSFRGNEIYVGTFDEAAGLKISDINLSLKDATAIGVLEAGQSLFSHNPDYVLQKGDQLIWIAEDDHPLQLQECAKADAGAFSHEPDAAEEPHTILVLGGSDLMKQFLIEEDTFAPSGSRVIIAAEPGRIDADNIPDPSAFENITVDLRECGILKRSVLEKLVGENPSCIILMSDTGLEAEEADARTLMLQLLLTDIAKEIGAELPLIIEMNTRRNQLLSQRMRATDFVIGSSITAKMMAQISEHRSKKDILNDLISSDGSAIYMKPVTRYIQPGSAVDFYTLGASAARYKEIAIGYKKNSEGGNFTIVINPGGREKMTFSGSDDLIVIADGSENC
ncbi:MAG: CASTOR/POLLUX-related putative ion channel [bacterium]